ncbi:MAG: prephenate dehydrogenase/arogenate dehydrogenase family protein [Acidobacteriota bacterium]
MQVKPPSCLIASMLFPHITIIGAGLIGGSFALAARRALLCEKITGWNGGHSLDEALSLGIIDSAEESFERGEVCEADLIYLAAPIGGIIEFLREQGRRIKPGVIITDAGSSKRGIIKAAREHLPGEVIFIGGHPMAGSHNAGVEFADADLFARAPYAIVIDEEKTSHAEAVDKTVRAVRAIGANPVFLTATDHDRIVARVSHAPQLISTALAAALSKISEEDAAKLSGRGLLGMTRLAASRWSVWEDILLSNADEISLALGEVASEIESLREALSSGNTEKMRDAFERANQFARGINNRR